ncbi:hypothetical protein D9M71_263620 [compost metagenome]
MDAALQRIVEGRAIPLEQLLLARRRTDQVEFAHRHFRVGGHLFQQAQQLLAELLDAARVEGIACITELQVEGAAEGDQHGQREMCLLAVAHLTEHQPLGRALGQSVGQRVVLKHQNAVEQRLAGMPGPALDIRQRRVLVLAQGQVLGLYGLQPLAHRQQRRSAGNHRQGINEQADLLFDPGQVGRASGHGGTETDLLLAAIALQQQQPGCLHQGVESDLLLAGEAVQALGGGCVQATVMITVATALNPGGDSRCQQGRGIEPRQALTPERLVAGRVLALQPGDVVAVAPWLGGRRLTAIALQHFTEQLRVAPAIHQHMVMGVDQLIARVTGTHQQHPQQRCAQQLETTAALLFGQRLQRRFLGCVCAPVMTGERQFGVFVDHLHRLIERALPDETAAQNLVRVQGGLPGGAETLRIEPVDLHL